MQPETKPHFVAPSGSSRSITGARTAQRFTPLTSGHRSMNPIALSVLLACSNASAEETVRFLPDDAQVACRAILPACFKRQDWAALCLRNLDIRSGHTEACDQAIEAVDP